MPLIGIPVEELKESDIFKEEIVYEDGRESYQTVEVNGLKSDKTRSQLKGVHSRGEFGTMLCTYAGWGMRIEFTPEDDVHRRPRLEVREPED